MKVVLSGNQDWILYLVMFALSAAVHSGVVFVIFVVEPSSAIEGQLVAPDEVGGGPPLASALSTWKSRLIGQEESMRADLQSKIKLLQRDRAADLEGWTRENAADRLKSLAELSGTDLADVRLERSGVGGKLDFLIQLNSEPAKVLADLALVSNLVGLATQGRGLSSEKLTIEVLDPASQAAAGRFEIRTEASRELATGHMTLKELFQEGLNPG